MLPHGAALVVIDVQQGFQDGTWGARNNPDAERRIGHLLATWRQANQPIWHIHHASRSPQGSFHRDGPGHQPQAEAVPAPGEPVIVKDVNSGFIGTSLENDLRSAGVTALVLVGLTTNHCVSTTARMAGNLGFATFVVEDATATFDRRGLDGQLRPAADVHAAALSDLDGEFATIVSSNEILSELPAPT